jgi:FAD-dependent urate hydroxylase
MQEDTRVGRWQLAVRQDQIGGGPPVTLRLTVNEQGLSLGAVQPAVELLGALESHLDRPIQLPVALNRSADGYVTNAVTRRSQVSGHPTVESLRIGGRMEDRDRCGADAHVSCLPPALRLPLGEAVTPPRRPLRVLVVGAAVAGISVARGLLRDGHDVAVFDQRSNVQAGGGAVTIWSNGETVLRQLGVDMDGAGQLLSSVRVITSSGRRLATVDVATMEDWLGAPVRMVPRRVLLQRLLEGFPAERIRCGSRAIGVSTQPDGVRVEFADGSTAEGDLLIGADGLHSTIRGVVGAPGAKPTGWCSWQGLVDFPEFADKHVGLIVIGDRGNLGLWPAGERELQWWFDLPWSSDFVRPTRPIELIRSNFAGWTDSVDLLLDKLSDDDLAPSPFPHFRHPIPAPGRGALTLLGDAAHTMPPTLAQGTNQALLDSMVLCKALSDLRQGIRFSAVPNALRWYEKTRRRRVAAVSRVASLQVAHGESVLRPAALLSDRLHTWTLTMFLRSTSHRRLSARISRDLALGSNPIRAPIRSAPR